MSLQSSLNPLPNPIFPAIKRRWLPATLVFVGTCILGISFLSQRRPSFIAEAQLQFQRQSSTPALIELGEELAEFRASNERSNPLSTEMEVLRSVNLIQQTITQLDLRDAQNQPLKREALLQQLKILEVRGTDTLKLTYQDHDAQRSAQVINTLLDLYLKDKVAKTREQVRSARRFVEQQLPQIQASVVVSEAALRQFKERNQVTAIAEDRTVSINVRKDLEQLITDTQAQISSLASQTAALRRQVGNSSVGAVMLTEISQNAGIQSALTELQTLDQTLALQAKQYRDQHPKMQQLRSQRRSLANLLQQRLSPVTGARSIPGQNLQVGRLQQDLARELVTTETNWQGQQRKLDQLLQAQREQRGRAARLPRLEEQERQLERKLEANQSTYTRLLQKRNELKVVEQQQIGNARVLSPAIVPDKPIAQSAMVLGPVVLGLLLAGGTVFILEKRDRTIKTIDQAKQYLGYTALGVIPWNGKRRRGLVGLKPIERPVEQMAIELESRSIMGLAYRMLQSNLKFASPDRPIQSLTITSSMPKEGKSLVTANLASAFTQAGKRVLIIDADLYRPTQHRIWKLNNNQGLSNMLVEQLRSQSAIKTVSDRLDVLPAGIVPPDSIAILDSQRMLKLMEQFQARYDMILIDTPSLKMGNDALVMGKISDGVLFVLRPEFATFDCLEFAKERLSQSEQRVIGQVVNGIIGKSERHSYYHHDNSETPTVSHPVA